MLLTLFSGSRKVDISGIRPIGNGLAELKLGKVQAVSKVLIAPLKKKKTTTTQ